jgi:PhnB protein
MGFTLTRGNNMTINLEPDTRAETDRLFSILAQGGEVEMPLQDMFWGAYFGLLVDRFGTRWMFNCVSKN